MELRVPMLTKFKNMYTKRFDGLDEATDHTEIAKVRKNLISRIHIYNLLSKIEREQLFVGGDMIRESCKWSGIAAQIFINPELSAADVRNNTAIENGAGFVPTLLFKCPIQNIKTMPRLKGLT